MDYVSDTEHFDKGEMDMNSIFKNRNEKDIVINLMWEIVLRETGVEDDAACD